LLLDILSFNQVFTYVIKVEVQAKNCAWYTKSKNCILHLFKLLMHAPQQLCVPDKADITLVQAEMEEKMKLKQTLESIDALYIITPPVKTQ